MTKLLSIDASTEACSVALLNGEQVTERYQIAPREHAQLLLPMVDSLLSESGIVLSQLDAIACNVGPGAFTGIRIAVSVAQGLSFAADLPAIAISSLANLAQQAFDSSDVEVCWPAIDARMQEVYLGHFVLNQQGFPETLTPEQVIAPELINFKQMSERHSSKVITIGSGWSAYPQQLKTGSQYILGCLDDKYPRASASFVMASNFFKAGLLLKSEELQPTYLRNNVAKKKVVKN
ncbi:tRNA (adenosine(37)-N6)-threonylcarbamoyltransferase complex dimerization subunit type 1 TsaB [Aliikangiella sp. IMCC44359]|uniref:tRNA (adenosine(37)-N6)-threonylcarbamoyltransferase complex dimerization subunit type 1 TsaB n=1 Tax=Aliikangiella sp. IMCC44359 TaxID=3459125 RepID=UPI00403B3216